MKKRPPYNRQAAIRGALRRCFSRSPIIREILQKVRREVPKYKKDGSRAKKDAVQYQCNICKNWVSSTKISVDHIDDVIPESGFSDWGTFIDRLFCGPENLQPLCDTCHDEKTLCARRARQLIKDKETFALLSRKRTLSPQEEKLLKRLTKKLNQ